MEGYGPSGAALVRIAEGGARLIVTVDCGAQAFEALAMAKAAGVDVIVVDHHKCASRLPDGFAIVNPNRLDESEEGAAQGHLAAVGMAFLLGVALRADAAGAGLFRGPRRSPICSSCSISSRSARSPTSRSCAASTAPSSPRASRSWPGVATSASPPWPTPRG